LEYFVHKYRERERERASSRSDRELEGKLKTELELESKREIPSNFFCGLDERSASAYVAPLAKLVHWIWTERTRQPAHARRNTLKKEEVCGRPVQPAL